MAVEIEQIPFACVPVRDIRHALDISATEEEWSEQDLGERKAAAQPSGQISVESAAPAGAEATA
jgi:hypothetical protein